MDVKSAIKSLSGTAAQMLFPEHITCFACGDELDGTSGGYLCGGCKLEYNKTFCRVCGRAIENLAELCDKCMEYGPHQFDCARSSVVFNETAKRLIYSFKYGGAQYLTDFLSGFMADTAQESGLSDADVITCVPLHKKRQRKRGYNQSELLAKALSAKIEIPYAVLLKKSTHTKNLARLSRTQRSEIIRGTFELDCDRSAVTGKSVLLIDDVLTTGATCDECARILKKAGAESVAALSFASVQVKMRY